MAKPKKSTRFLSSKRIILAVAGLIIVAQGAFNYYLYMRPVSLDTTITSLITNAVDGLSRPAVLDIEGKAFMPDARLTFPVDAQAAQLLYRYDAAADSYPGEAKITTTAVMGSAKVKLLNAQSSQASLGNTLKKQGEVELKVFGHVPNLQACSRGVHIVFGELKELDGLKQVGDKRLADGRTITFYQETGCDGDLDSLAAYVKQVESY